MAVESHLKNLLERHTKLDREIHQIELTNADVNSIHTLKKQKLKLKEEIERIKLHTGPAASYPTPEHYSKEVH